MIFATYFDSAYWPKARAMWRSLKRHAPQAQLWALCWDGAAVVNACEAGMTAQTADNFIAERPHLRLSALPGPTRTLAEHMWTVGPHWVVEVMRQTRQPVTYVDADLFFFANPGPLLAECTEPAGVVPHNFCEAAPIPGLPIPTQATHEAFGRYNVGLVHFNDAAVAEDWASACRTWCYDRLEVPLPERAARYGDQKYLDDWPERYGARVFSPGVCLGPWGLWNGQLMEVDGRTWWRTAPTWEPARTYEALIEPVVSYHFSSYKQLPHGGEQLTRPEYCLTTEHERILYHPYREALREP